LSYTGLEPKTTGQDTCMEYSEEEPLCIAWLKWLDWIAKCMQTKYAQSRNGAVTPHYYKSTINSEFR